jgi:hypothetical protein
MRRLFLLALLACLALAAPAQASLTVTSDTYQWVTRYDYLGNVSDCDGGQESPGPYALDEDDMALATARGTLATSEAWTFTHLYPTCQMRFEYGEAIFSGKKRNDRPLGQVTLTADLSVRTGEPPPTTTFTDDGVQRTSVYDCHYWHHCYVVKFCLRWMGSFSPAWWNHVRVTLRNTGDLANTYLLTGSHTLGQWAEGWTEATCPGQS